MPELFEFSLLDMTPYDQQSWFNLVADYQRALWPIQWLAVTLMLALLYFAFRSATTVSRPAQVTLALVILGCSWLWCGAVFHWQHFANLNWAAPWFGWVFMAQGSLLILVAARLKSAAFVPLASPRGRLGLLVLFIGLLVYPLSGLLEGRHLLQLEWFPFLPAPVTLVSFALIILLASRWRHLLVVIPVLWGVVSAAFAYTLGLFECYFIAAGVGLWLLHFVSSEKVSVSMNN